MINVNTVYKSVLSILNKEQRGYLTPDEFNKLAKQTQLNLLEVAFAEYNKFLSMDNLGRINAGYADLPEKIKEKIEVFYATSNLSAPYALPVDVFKLIDVNMLNKTVSLEEIDKNELSYILSSPLTKPSKDFPVYYKTTTAATGATSIVVSPTIADTISVDYIKIPTDPRFGYTVNTTYGTNTYDSSVYVDGGLIIGTPAIGIISTNQTGITNGTQNLTVGVDGVTTSGNCTGAAFTITITGTTITNIQITGAGSGFAVGDTITIPTTFTWMSGSPVVLTLGRIHLYNTTTQGSTNFELHPSEETMLIMGILSGAGIVIKSQDISSYTARAMQAQAAIKAQ